MPCDASVRRKAGARFIRDRDLLYEARYIENLARDGALNAYASAGPRFFANALARTAEQKGAPLLTLP